MKHKMKVFSSGNRHGFFNFEKGVRLGQLGTRPIPEINGRIYDKSALDKEAEDVFGRQLLALGYISPSAQSEPHVGTCIVLQGDKLDVDLYLRVTKLPDPYASMKEPGYIEPEPLLLAPRFWRSLTEGRWIYDNGQMNLDYFDMHRCKDKSVFAFEFTLAKYILGVPHYPAD